MHALKKLPAIEADVAEAAEWYETQRPGLGQRFVSAVQSADKSLLANPLRFAVRFADVRRLNLADFPYGIFFLPSRRRDRHPGRPPQSTRYPRHPGKKTPTCLTNYWLNW
jgi:hypothetical protein